METIDEAARAYVANNFLLHTIWAQETQDAFVSGAKWMEKEMQAKVDELRRIKINLHKKVDELEQQLIDAGITIPAIIQDYSHNA